jgi:hypothetical protein
MPSTHCVTELFKAALILTVGLAIEQEADARARNIHLNFFDLLSIVSSPLE